MAWKRSHPLTTDNVTEKVKGRQYGVYLLGHLYADEFIPDYVGRSDSDLRVRLLQHVDSGYRHFTFQYTSSARDSYQGECRFYHKNKRKLDNINHPAKPEGSRWKCPIGSCNR